MSQIGKPNNLEHLYIANLAGFKKIRTSCAMMLLPLPLTYSLVPTSFPAHNKVCNVLTKKEQMKASIWIIPPPPYLDTLSAQIKELAHLNDAPPFTPHVTIATNIELDDNIDDAGSLLVEELKGKFHSSFRTSKDGADGGGIPCRFDRSKGFMTGYNNGKDLVWSQACVGIIQRDERLIRAVELAKRCLYESKYVIGVKDEASLVVEFASPLKEPHLSFAYKLSEINNDTVKTIFGECLPEDFISSEMVLMKTNPLSVDGVADWVPIGSFAL